MPPPKRFNDKGLPYIEAHYNDKGGDLSARWYVEFYAWDEVKGARRRSRIYKLEGDTVAARRTDCERLVNVINRQLASGWLFTAKKGEMLNEPQEQPLTERTPMKQALAYALRGKELHIRESSYKDYSLTLKHFLAWAEGRSLDTVPVGGFNSALAAQALDEMQRKRGIGNTTRNNWKTILSALFNFLVDRGVIGANPFAKVRRLREEVGKNLALPAGHVARMKRVMQEEHPTLWLFCLFIYGTLCRPKEIRLSRVEQIDWRSGRFHVPAAISKNREAASVSMPRQLIDALKEAGVDKLPTKAFIFSLEKDHSREWSQNYAGSHHRAMVRRVLGDDRYTLYGWKHTGAAALYEASKDIMLVKQQCRHSNVTMTEKYLKSLGLSANTRVQEHYRPI